MTKKHYIILFLFFLISHLVISQALSDLQGSFLVEQDGITNSYEFKKRKLIVKVNVNDAFKERFTYYYNIRENDDKTLRVYLYDFKTETVEDDGEKKKKPKSISRPNMTLMYFWSVWTLEKVEDEKLYIRVDPPSPKWPSKNNWEDEYYSGFEDNFVLIPIKS